MIRRVIGIGLSTALAFAPAIAAAAPAPAVNKNVTADVEVAKGIKLVEDGDYDSAILTLDNASRRLAMDPRATPDLSQAYLYMGIAYVGKGHDAAKFREALLQIKGLTLSADKFPPKVINVFEAAREEVRREGQRGFVPAEVKGKSKLPVILAGVGLAGAAAVVVNSRGEPATDDVVDDVTTFPEQVLERFSVRDYAVEVKRPGTLQAKVEWVEDRMLLGLSIANLTAPETALANGLQTAAKQTSLSLGVTPGTYRISVSHTGNNPLVPATYTLIVIHP